jgi:hypothetical protein
LDYFGVFLSDHMCFSVIGHCGLKNKKADLSLKINFFQFFRSRFGFLVQFYPYPELEIKKYAQGQELLIFAVFLKNWPTVSCLKKRDTHQSKAHVKFSRFVLFLNFIYGVFGQK